MGGSTHAWEAPHAFPLLSTPAPAILTYTVEYIVERGQRSFPLSSRAIEEKRKVEK
jgi:hypothetical protein